MTYPEKKLGEKKQRGREGGERAGAKGGFSREIDRYKDMKQTSKKTFNPGATLLAYINRLASLSRGDDSYLQHNIPPTHTRPVLRK